jgi:ferredoxin--NADP+ reductase
MPPDPAVPEPDALYNATLVERQDLTDELAMVRVLPDAGVPGYKPGQYATLGLMPDPTTELGKIQAAKKGLAKLVLRPYSLSSSPLDERGLETYLALVPDGAFTPLAWNLGEGDRLYVAPKCKGKFTLDGIPADRKLVAIATGTGLAPFVSMIRTYRETGRWQRFAIVHGVRYRGDLGYRAELEAFAEKDESITYISTCSREAEPEGQGDWFGLRGRVNVAVEEKAFNDLAGFPLDPEDCHVLLCGNPAMIDEMTDLLVARGFTPKDRQHPDGNIHFEKYW